jgi:hypothetical protein
MTPNVLASVGVGVIGVVVGSILTARAIDRFGATGGQVVLGLYAIALGALLMYV